mgnify:CR=1 FL=1
MKILYLTQDPERIREQLAGQRLARAQALPLRDDVSTDEITPVAILSHYDATLGDFAHTGLHCQGQAPIARGQLRAAGSKAQVVTLGADSSPMNWPKAYRVPVASASPVATSGRTIR